MEDRDPLLWANRVFGQCDLGDGRRTARLVALGADLAESGGGTVSSACRENSASVEGGYRLLRNKRVGASAIVEGGCMSTAEMARELECMLAIQDTTTLSYSHSVIDQLGDLGGPEGSTNRGWFVHNTLLLDARTGKTVGLIDQERWLRDPATRGKRHERKKTPYQDKESFKWQAASERIRTRLSADVMSRVIEVCDREADVFEYLDYKFGLEERFIVRARHDRCVDSEEGRLQQTVSEQHKLGDYEVRIPQRGGQKAASGQKSRKGRKERTATVTLRSAHVTFRSPSRRDKELPELQLWIIQAREESPPPGEDGLEWLLLTTEPAGCFDAARTLVKYYELRWRIEEYHKVWKSGCGVEDLRLQEPANLERMAAILAFVAVRLIQLKEMAEDKSELPCTVILSDLGWKCLWLSLLKRGDPPVLPATPPTLTWAHNAIARLGGFQDTKRTGRAGWATVWKGWRKLADRVEGFELAMRWRAEEM